MNPDKLNKNIAGKKIFYVILSKCVDSQQHDSETEENTLCCSAEIKSATLKNQLTLNKTKTRESEDSETQGKNV